MSSPAHLTLPVPAEAAGTTSSGTIRSHDGLDLHFKRFHPPPSVPVQASVVFVHGFIEYIDRYNETFPLFAARGIELIAFDQRGFGQTAMKAQGGWKTHYSNTTWPQQFEDAKAVMVEQRKWLDEKYGGGKTSLFLLGHSMGGGISAGLFTRHPTSKESESLGVLRGQISGVVCSSPWLTLTKPPPGLITALAPTLLRFFPNLKYPAPLRAQDLTRDVAVQEAWKTDPLISGWVHAKSAWGPLTGGPKIVSDEYKYWPAELPLLVAHGEDDNVTDPKGSQQFVENLKSNGARDVEYKGFPDSRHEMMFEIDPVKSEFANTIIDWIHARAGAKPSQGVAAPSAPASDDAATAAVPAATSEAVTEEQVGAAQEAAKRDTKL